MGKRKETLTTIKQPWNEIQPKKHTHTYTNVTNRTNITKQEHNANIAY